MATPASSYTITAGILQAYPSSSNPFIAAGPDTYTFLRYDTFNAMVSTGAITTTVTVVPASGSLPAGYAPAAAWSSQPSVAAFKALDPVNTYLIEVVNTFLVKQFATFDAATGLITFRATVAGSGGGSGSFSNQPLFLGAAKVTGINWDFRNSVVKGLIETTEATAPIPLSQLNKSVTDLQTKIDAITSKDSDLQSQITDEVTRAKAAEDAINSTLTGYSSSFSTDVITSTSGKGIQLNGGEVVFENGFQAGNAIVYYFTSNIASCGRLTSHSDQTSIEVQTSFAMSNNSITDILDAVNPQDVPAYHQLIDAVAVEKARAEAKEKSLTDSITEEVSRAETKESELQTSVDTINATISPYPQIFSTKLLAASAIKSQLSYSDLLLPDTIGDISYYPPNQLVLLQTLDISPTADPETNLFVGWYVCGNGIPTGTTILNYRYDYTNYSSVGRAIYANLSNDIGEPSGTYTICVAMKVKSDIDFQNSFSCLNITDAVHPQEAAAFHQIADAVTVETLRAEAKEAELKSQIDSLNASVTALNLFCKAINKVMFHNDNLTPPV
jgi:hypothetical protein